MIGKTLIKERPITNVEAKEYLEEFEKQYKDAEKDVGYELEQSLKYTKKFSKVTAKESKEMHSKLSELKLPEKIIVELINIKPQNPELVRAILFKRTEFDDAKVDKILSILKK